MALPSHVLIKTVTLSPDQAPIRLWGALFKAAGVGDGERRIAGTVSGEFQDVEGDIMAPSAVREAIPLFMAPRGQGEVAGGPVRWYHEDKLYDKRALPIGRVTRLWVDNDGFTHFEAVLAKANPRSAVLWKLIQEGVVAIGASLGGSILEYQTRWNPQNHQFYRNITKIRIDELSLTDNPAFRTAEQLPDGSYGSYVMAKSASSRHWASEPRDRRGRWTRRQSFAVLKQAVRNVSTLPLSAEIPLETVRQHADDYHDRLIAEVGRHMAAGDDDKALRLHGKAYRLRQHVLPALDGAIALQKSAEPEDLEPSIVSNNGSSIIANNAGG